MCRLPLGIFPPHVAGWEPLLLCACSMVNKSIAGCRYERRGTTFTRVIPPPCPKTQGAGGSIPFARHTRRPSGSFGPLRTDGGSLRGATQARCGSRYGQKLGRRSTRALSRRCGRLSRREHAISQPCSTTKTVLGAARRRSSMEEPQANAAPSDDEHYREMAKKLREIARQFRFPGPRQELL